MPLDTDCSVELSLPSSPDLARVERALDHLAPGVPVVGLTDNHAGRARLSPLAAISACVRRGVRPVVHLSCRDRNWLGLRQQVLGAAALGASGILVVRGDEVPGQRVPGVAVTEVLRQIPEWVAPRPVWRGAVVNPFADPTRELRLLERKVAAGIDFLQTQMVFDPDRLDRFLDAASGIVPPQVPIFASLGLLRSERMLRFVSTRLPDCPIPPALAHRIEGGEGRAVARELAAAIGSRPAVRLHVIPLGAEAEVRRVVRAFRAARRSARSGDRVLAAAQPGPGSPA